jgi:8-oxo-dGTP diphosphatase
MSGIGPHVRVVSAELLVNGRYLITQRRADAVLPLLWEFPGGRVRDGESDAAALVRCLRDRVGLDVEVVEPTMEVTHAYETYTLTLAVYRCALPSGQEARAAHVAAVAWVSPDEFGQYVFPGADQHTVDALVGAMDT